MKDRGKSETINKKIIIYADGGEEGLYGRQETGT